jgi:hypothetical protein
VGLTLYLIGAGLTKSLELTRRVPMMMDFVRVLTEYVDNDVVLNTLVTMELGKAYETACDECLRLATQLGRNVPATAKAERDQFAALVWGRQPESIEALFQRVESTSSPNIYGSGLGNYFRYAINQVFSVIGWDLQLDLLTRFLTKQFQDDDRRKHVFVSFNYDLALERAVEIASAGLWQPRDGYGFEIPFYTTDDPSSDSPRDALTALSSEELLKGSSRVQVLKPHGSLNWLGPRQSITSSQKRAADTASMIVPLNNNLELRYWGGTNTFNYVSFPNQLPDDIEILIAPPSLTKPPIVPQIRSLELDAIKEADAVFVVGYSMPRTDRDQWELISSAVKDRDTAIRTLTIINRSASPEYIGDIKSIFKPQSIRIFNDGFADYSERS